MDVSYIYDTYLAYITYKFYPISPERENPVNRQMYDDLKASLIEIYGEPEEDNEESLPIHHTNWQFSKNDISLSLFSRSKWENAPYCYISYSLYPLFAQTETLEATEIPSSTPTPAPVLNNGL